MDIYESNSTLNDPNAFPELFYDDSAKEVSFGGLGGLGTWPGLGLLNNDDDPVKAVSFDMLPLLMMSLTGESTGITTMSFTGESTDINPDNQNDEVHFKEISGDDY